ncbi:hypothetical protein LCGC14_1495770 [marine sediment metagenome]|uniref:Uncharacterized protein n=1 Tax=marine sediment metagenome TaxID=412755 RepID=A0A0F9J628_9ZZZZ|nr:glycosyltransferase [Candidatus Aminicenantes bacterium]
MDKTGKFEFLGLFFNNFTLDEVIKRVEQFIMEKITRMIFTPNAESIIQSHHNRILKDIYNRADILTVDSWVVYYASKLLGSPLQEPVTASRTMFKFIDHATDKGYTIYLLGAEPCVVNMAVQNLRKKYPKLKIAGWHHGYFDFDKDEEVVNQIKDSKSDVLFVGMSTPLKEKFISKNLKKLNIPVCIGVGGSFDILAEKCKLAPKWVGKIGLEWFYRLIQEPRRLWTRYLLTNTEFIYLFLKEFIKIKILHRKH